MTPIRLGDKLTELSDLEQEYIRIDLGIENLIMKILFPSVEAGNLPNYYIPRFPTTENLTFDISIPRLGEFEKHLLDKVLNPITRTIVLVGSMGSGKTTTLNFVVFALKKIQERKLISKLDFREFANLNNLTGKDLVDELLRILCDELLARLRLSISISSEEEFTKFWKKEVDLYKSQNASSKAFRAILANSHDKDILDFSNSSEETVNRRTDILMKVKQNNELYFNYLLRLWEYTASEYGGNIPGLILLDNLDSVSTEVQKKVLELVLANAQLNGPLFILTMRPETFDRMGIGDQIFDVEQQKGPSPIDVILDRVSSFIKEPDKYLENSPLLPEPLYETIKRIKDVHNILSENNGKKAFDDFLSAVCGDSIRASLILFSSMLYSLPVMRRSSLSLHFLIQSGIREGNRQYRWNGRNVIQNLFQVAGSGQTSLLVKLRILKLLDASANHKRSLAEIRNATMQFYEESLIIAALNEMLAVNSQLILSNTLDVFSEKDFHVQGEIITLTKIGEGYLNRMINNIDYIQEMMLDTYINLVTPSFETNNFLFDKLNLVTVFLRELLRSDVGEVTSFLERFGAKAYFDLFGTNLIAVEIIQNAYIGIKRIIQSTPGAKLEYESLKTLEAMEDLVLNIENNNVQLLGTTVPSVLRK